MKKLRKANYNKLQTENNEHDKRESFCILQTTAEVIKKKVELVDYRRFDDGFEGQGEPST